MEYIFLDNVSSTQDFIKDRLKEGKEKTVVLSKSQKMGRGRRDRKWEAPIGGLWFSFDTSYDDELITIKVGVAVREICSEIYKCDLLLKWPNDLILNNKKVAGILCEKVKDRVIIGIGINTNIEKIEVENSISFLSVTRKVIDNEELMKQIIDRFLNLKNEEVINKFRENMAFIGEERYISALDKTAKIIGISDEGHLIIEDNGDKKDIFVGEILIDRN